MDKVALEDILDGNLDTFDFDVSDAVFGLNDHIDLEEAHRLEDKNRSRQLPEAKQIFGTVRGGAKQETCARSTLLTRREVDKWTVDESGRHLHSRRGSSRHGSRWKHDRRGWEHGCHCRRRRGKGAAEGAPLRAYLPA